MLKANMISIFRGEMAAGLTRTVLQIRLEQKLNSQSDLTGRFSQEMKGSTHGKSYTILWSVKTLDKIVEICGVILLRFS